MQPVPIARCGMPCGLCPMYHVKGPSRCLGCSDAADSYAAKCSIFRCCGQRQESMCALCDAYPCEKIDGMTEFPNFDTQKIWLEINAEIRAIGQDAWMPGYETRCALLAQAMDRYNDGRMKSYLCKLFIRQPLPELQAVMAQADALDIADAKARGKAFKEIVRQVCPEL